MGDMAIVRGGITVKPHVQAMADALAAEFGLTSFGTYNGHSPPEGPTQALDIFTPDNPAGYELQDRICAFARRHAEKFGVRYAIRRAAIWNIERDDEDWRAQRRTGNRVQDHMEHVHLTFYATAAVAPTPPPTKGTRMDFIYWIRDNAYLVCSAGVVQIAGPHDLARFQSLGVKDIGELTAEQHHYFTR